MPLCKAGVQGAAAGAVRRVLGRVPQVVSVLKRSLQCDPDGFEALL